MLRRVGETVDSKDAVVKIKDASFPTPFVSALEYNSPVHGNWNIVHTGMQVPESIQIYVCADNCMRGVVLTAAEMNAADRFSFVLVKLQRSSPAALLPSKSSCLIGEPVRTAFPSGRYLSVSGKLQHILVAFLIAILLARPGVISDSWIITGI